MKTDPPVVAITGASGFVGRHVITALSKRHAKIVALARAPQRLSALPQNLEVIEFDIERFSTDIYEQIGHPDVLIHLAWDKLPNYRSPHHYEIELPRQYRFLKTMVESGLRSLLVSGTCFEYGLQPGALSESTAPQPITSYGYAKDSLRRQLQFLRASLPFSLTWARLFYMHGDGQPETSLRQQLEKAVRQGRQMFDMSGGEQLRDYLSVAVVAEWIAHLALSCPDSGIVNICSGKPVSVRKLVEEWIEHNKWDIKPNLGVYPYPDYEPLAFWGTNDKLIGLLQNDP